MAEMNKEQIEQELSIIKNMIEKTRRDTLESGSLFIFVGVGSIMFIAIVTLLEMMHYSALIQPAMVAMTIILGIVGFFVVRQREQKEKIPSYTQKVGLILVTACAIPMILTGLIFPLTGVYIWDIVPVFIALILGIILFASGTVFDFRYFYWSGLGSWLGALVMAYTLDSQFPVRGVVMILILVIGFIIPGFIFHRNYKNAEQSNGS